MTIIIQHPDFKPSPELIEFVHTHTGKLASLSDRILEARVLMKLNKSDTRQNKVCEIRLVIPGNDLFASHESSSFEEALTKTTDALKVQVERWKDSTRPRRHKIN